MALPPQQKAISVWIGKIGSNVPDRLLRSALELIEGLLAWKRDGKGGILRTFGFADFSSPLGALLAKSIFNDLPLGDSTLSVKIDEKTQKSIDTWTQSNPDQAQKSENPSELKVSILKLFNDAGVPAGSDVSKDSASNSHSSASQHNTSTENGENKEKNGASTSATAPPNVRLTPAQKKLLMQEQRREEEKKRDMERKMELMEEDKERERKRLEKGEQLYQKMWRDFDDEQRDRKAAIEKRKRSDEEAQKLRLEDLEDENTLLWGDEEDRLRREKELKKKYMSNEFVKMRKREAEFDAAAKAEEEAEHRAELRRLEEQHKEQVKKQQEEQAARMKAERERSKHSEAQAASSSHIHDPHSSSSKKRNGQTQSSMDRDGSSKSAKMDEHQKTPHSGLQSSSNATITHPFDSMGDDTSLNPSLTTSTSSLKIAALNAKIPSDVSALFATPIRYDLLEQSNAMELIFKPWVTKKIFEYLEVEEETMIHFICTHLAERKPTQELIAQLQPVLDDDAEIFVITLTRLLLLESLKLEE